MNNLYEKSSVAARESETTLRRFSVNTSVSFTDPMLVDTGETVMQLPLHLALCRAVYDLSRDVPFAIRSIDGGEPLVVYNGNDLSGSDTALVDLVNLEAADCSAIETSTQAGDLQ